MSGAPVSSGWGNSFTYLTRRWTRANQDRGESDSPAIDLEACRQIDTSEWPPAIDCSAEQPVTDEFLHSLRTSDERLDIKVGKKKTARRWKVHKALICRYSGYFEGACRHSGAGFRENTNGVFELVQDDPIAFELFIKWLYSNNKQAQNFQLKSATDTEAWKLYAGEACIVGDKFLATDFTKFALSKVIQNAHLLDVYDMESIYENTLPNTPLRRFAARWAHYRCALQPTLWDSTHNGDFQRDRRHHNRHHREPPPQNQAVLDPRRFEIEHWHSECSQTRASCGHATVPTGSDETTKVRTEPDFQRLLSKRERHRRSTWVTILLPAFFVTYSGKLAELGFLAVIIGIAVMVVVLSVLYCHCGHCSGCHGCGPCEPCNCLQCHRWCTHHAFLFCCDCGGCECCGGFPFCCFVKCCCKDGYDPGQDCC